MALCVGVEGGSEGTCSHEVSSLRFTLPFSVNAIRRHGIDHPHTGKEVCYSPHKHTVRQYWATFLVSGQYVHRWEGTSRLEKDGTGVIYEVPETATEEATSA